MTRILLLFAHPALEKSRVHRRLLAHVPAGVTVNDLYQVYPDFDIDVAREQSLLREHDLVLLQHPLYWYSTPALLKQWQDLVLEHGWAYGSTGTALRGKRMASVITTGGREEAYTHEGLNRFTMRELLAPIEQTARLCGMDYLPPYLIQGTHRMTLDQIEAEARRYGETLALVRDDRIRQGDWEAAGTLGEAAAPQLAEAVRP